MSINLSKNNYSKMGLITEMVDFSINVQKYLINGQIEDK